jgi:hypothetical protein
MFPPLGFDPRFLSSDLSDTFILSQGVKNEEDSDFISNILEKSMLYERNWMPPRMQGALMYFISELGNFPL